MAKKEKKCECTTYGPTILRLFLGLLFIIPGAGKLVDPDGIISMLSGLGFPAAAFFGWLLLLSEIVFGVTVLLGWKLKYTVWPLVIVLGVATILVYLPNIGEAMGMITVLFHLLGMGALISLFLTGPGNWAVGKE